jgi:hypothetical protein
MVFVFSIFCWGSVAINAFAGFEKDPLKETQSDTVPVTEELLTREGQAGPASPTYPMADTSGFLVQMPYEKAEEYRAGEEEKEFSRHFWDRWFFWRRDDQQKETSEPIENK